MMNNGSSAISGGSGTHQPLDQSQRLAQRNLYMSNSSDKNEVGDKIKDVYLKNWIVAN